MFKPLLSPGTCTHTHTHTYTHTYTHTHTHTHTNTHGPWYRPVQGGFHSEQLERGRRPAPAPRSLQRAPRAVAPPPFFPLYPHPSRTPVGFVKWSKLQARLTAGLLKRRRGRFLPRSIAVVPTAKSTSSPSRCAKHTLLTSAVATSCPGLAGHLRRGLFAARSPGAAAPDSECGVGWVNEGGARPISTG